MRCLSAILFCLVLPAMVAAQDTTANVDPDRAERLVAAQRYIDNPVQQQVMSQILSPETFVAQLGAMVQQVPAETQTEIVAMITEEMTAFRPVMEAAMVETAADVFTLEELEALDTFMRSEVGSSAMAKTQPFMLQTMARLGPDLQQMQANLIARHLQVAPQVQ